MKKIRNLFLIMLAVTAVLFTACGSKDDDEEPPATPTYDVPGAYTNAQPYDTQGDDGWEENACGAISMAYYLAEQGFIPKEKIKEFAKTFYDEVKFTGTAAETFGDYSDPVKIRDKIAPYAKEAKLKMNKSGSEEAELLLSALVTALQIPDTEIAQGTVDELAKGDYVIEIVVPHSSVNPNHTSNELHYVLTYWKGDTLYTLDTYEGTEYPRAGFKTGTPDTYCFCNGGIFLTPKN